jgi:peptidoglycan hydrolase-like protein with peptidoglycan-binding domain
LENAEVVENKEVAPTPVATEEPTPSAETSVVAPALVAVVKNLTTADIRRIQTRLRDVGLDPGPVDGVAGGRTKTAFARFRAGCEQVEGLLTDEKSLPSGSAQAKNLGRQETLTLQTQLHRAGFNPGPVDGIFGGRTRSVLDQLRSGCPTVKDYAALSEQAAPTMNKNIAVPQASEQVNAPLGSQAVLSSRPELIKAVALTNAVQPREEVRILQLRLRDAGYDPGPFDGFMGPKTKLAMQQLQASQKAGKTKTSLTTGIATQY